MGIPLKGIGWSQESNLLYQILKQLNKLTSIIFGLKESATPKYKVYTALLTQSGTSAPIAIILENTLGGDIVWTRSAIGNYLATLSNAFSENKTFLYIGQGTYGADFPNFFSINRNSSSEIGVLSQVFDGTFGDELIGVLPIEIRVYN